MRDLLRHSCAALKELLEHTWHYTGSLAAVCLFAAALGLGIYHAVVQRDEPVVFRCYAGVENPAGAEPPRGLLPLGQGELKGAPHVRVEYGADGRVTRMRHLDAQGKLSPLPGSHVAEQLLFYDHNARLIRRENKDAQGAPAEDAQGVAVREFDYDAAGRLVRSQFRDAGGRLTVPRFPGYAESRLNYDAEGRLSRIEYLDAEERPVLNAEGEQCVVYSYGEDGRVTRENRVSGLPADSHSGVARELLEMLPQGTRRSWQRADGSPAVHPSSGAVAVQYDEHLDYGLQRRCYMDETGRPCGAQRACAEHLQRHDQRGRLEWECFSGADGLPVNHPSRGYAERVCEYAPDGGLAREFFWDAAGNPAPLYERRFFGDHDLTLHSDGSTAVQPLR